MDIHRPDLAKKNKRRKLIGTTLSALFLVAITSGMLLYDPGPLEVDKQLVFTATVEHGDMVQQVRGTGTLKPSKMLWISAQTAGRVERIYVLPGAEVTPDTIIMELTNPELQQQYHNAQLQLHSDKAAFLSREVTLKSDLLQQKSTLARYTADYKKAALNADIDQQLFKQGLESSQNTQRSALTAEQLKVQLSIEKQRYSFREESMAAQLAVEQSRIEQSKARFALLAAQISALQVKAGFDGVLQRQTIKEGQRVTPGTSLAQVVNPKSLKAEIRVSEHQAKDILIGLKAHVDTRSGTAEGEVVRIDPNVEEGTVAVDIALTGDLPNGARPNLTIEGVIEIANIPNTHFVKRPIHSKQNSTAKVFKINQQGIAQQVAIKFGRSSVYRIEVLEGLATGDNIIISDTSEWLSHERILLN